MVLTLSLIATFISQKVKIKLKNPKNNSNTSALSKGTNDNFLQKMLTSAKLRSFWF